MASPIKYSRGTTYTITHTYNGPNPGVTLMFTVKTLQSDTDTTDTQLVASAGDVIVHKDVAMTGTGTQTTVLTILPTDVSVTVPPGNYSCDLKVLDNTGAIYLVYSGQFILSATPTNRFS